MEQTNRSKLFDVFKPDTDALVYLRGGTVSHRYNTDFEYAFRQESNFLYLTGIAEPDFHVLFDLKDRTWHLVLPKRDSKYAVWMGYVNSADYYKEAFKADSVFYDDKLELVFRKRKPETVYCNGEAEAQFVSNFGLKTDSATLPEALAYCRSIKTDRELELMRRASKAASEAHLIAMKRAQTAEWEYEVKADYEHHLIKQGMLHHPYNGIFASGKNSAILHYVDNSRRIPKGSHFLIDAGAEYKGYAADITRTFPVSGKFDGVFGDLYRIVLRALAETTSGARPGIKMEDLHLHACQVILSGLKDLGLVHGSIDDMMQVNLFALFFPHGLGHFLGLDTHDVGGYLKGIEPIDRPGLRFLRARRTLEKGMVVTIEPGLYMIPALLEPAFSDPKHKPFLNESKLRGLLDFGGIRIEDNLVITETGYENLTNVPKKPEDIEAILS
ncbi:MAG: aminopeptidase P family protein [Balneolales bacterium]|nr:aminopeptidase P family protein [Balneolales bacterium]